MPRTGDGRGRARDYLQPVRRVAFTLRETEPLAEHPFRLLFAARFVSLFGTGMAPIAIAFAVLDVRASASALSLVIAARMLPMVGFLLIGGVIADRFPRGRVMVVSNLIAGTAQAATAALLLVGTPRLWELVALQFVGGAGAALFMPALNGIVPQIAKDAHRQQANALLGLSRDIARIAGAAAGGVIVAAAGAGWGIGVDAASFFVAAALLAPLRVAKPEPASVQPFVRELSDGWREFRARRWVWLVSAQFAISNAAGMGSFFVLGPLVAKHSLGGPAAWGFIMTANATGLVLGGLIGLRIRLPRPLLAAPVCAAFIVPVLGLLAIEASVQLIAVAALAAGLTAAIFTVFWDTTLQRYVPQEKLSRVTSYNVVTSFASIPLGVVGVGAVSAWVGTSTTLWASSVAVGVAALATLASRDVRELGEPSRRFRLAGPPAGSGI